ncbi:MAG: tripartite tricarboxylate transporter TctB family protein [Planctomycetota bacterium]|jgi:hypothetical protein|nr:tripartite tricarboxylate transporter TctB family protein [Planctomycetota bacterium]
MIIGLAFVALGVFVYLEAAKMPSARRGIGPGGYPTFVACGLAALGLIMTCQALAGARGREGSSSCGYGSRVAFLVVLTAAYIVLVRPLGFIVSSILYQGAACRFFGYRKWLPAITVAVAVPIMVYVIFRHAFLVLLPTGDIFR